MPFVHSKKKEPKEACISYLSHTPYLLFITYIYSILFWEEKRISQNDDFCMGSGLFSVCHIGVRCVYVMYVCNYAVSNVFFIYLQTFFTMQSLDVKTLLYDHMMWIFHSIVPVLIVFFFYIISFTLWHLTCDLDSKHFRTVFSCIVCMVFPNKKNSLIFLMNLLFGGLALYNYFLY